jgi:hypothetical protein
MCLALGQAAVHAAMAGKTNAVIGFWNQHCTHIPIALAALKRKKVDPKGYLWQTGVPVADRPRHHRPGGIFLSAIDTMARLRLEYAKCLPELSFLTASE